MEEETPYARPDLYDLLAPTDPGIERFYLGAAADAGGSILDLACGSDRFAVPLARAGNSVVGGDASAQMLERARANAAEAGVPVSFVQLDMRDFDLDRQFGLVLIAANSLLHLKTDDDLRRCFRAIARHLAANGCLAFDTFVPNEAILSRDPAQRFLVDVVVHPELGRVTVEETTRYDPPSRISHTMWFWSTESERDFWVTPLDLRQITPEELPGLLDAGGLRLVDRFGDFDRGPFGVVASPRQVCIAMAA